jgi:peptidylprolyl isomerase
MSSSFDQQLATKPAAVTPPTEAFAELKVTTLIQGTGAAVTSGQSVTVNYVGISRTTGEEFDSSWSRDQPFTFVIGSGGVIQGWSQGLLGVAVGSRVELDIPSELAYGDQGRVPGDLIFIVDVLSAS